MPFITYRLNCIIVNYTYRFHRLTCCFLLLSFSLLPLKNKREIKKIHNTQHQTLLHSDLKSFQTSLTSINKICILPFPYSFFTLLLWWVEVHCGFTKLLTVYQLYHTWIHSPLPFFFISLPQFLD
jgi:hypothetical protein